jgi:hypothetical protein
MSQINVVRPFVYTRKPPKGLKVPVELWFKVGVHEIDDETASDPFISKYFADGCIETPAQAQERARVATEQATRIQREADEANLFAKQAYDRAVAAAQIGGKLRREDPPASAPVPGANAGAAEATAGTTSGTEPAADSKAPTTDAAPAPAPETAPAPTAETPAASASPSAAAPNGNQKRGNK